MGQPIRNVIFMGTPDFAAGILEALIESDYHVQAVFCQPDKPVGRKAVLKPCAVKETALAAEIPVYQPKRMRNPENLQILQQYQPDVIVVAAYGQILPAEVLHAAPYGCINVHASLLPAWRGAAPIQWSVICGDEYSGVTTMQMSEGLDTGDMLEKASVKLEADETGGSLFDKLQTVGASLLLETLQHLEEGSIIPEEQPEESPTPYAAMLTKQTGLIDWSQSAEQIERLVRGLDPWPSAWTYLEGKQLKIWRASCGMPADVEVKEQPGANGRILHAGHGALWVQTGSGILAVRELQLEGKKRMDADAFLRGYRLLPEAELGKER